MRTYGMKKSTAKKSTTKKDPRKSARAKSTEPKNNGQNAAEEQPKLSPGEEQKRRLLSLPPAGQGRTVISPTPLDEISE